MIQTTAKQTLVLINGHCNNSNSGMNYVNEEQSNKHQIMGITIECFIVNVITAK